MSVPVALTVSGSDPAGGAGIQADLKTFEALGVYGTSVVTAVTAQNTVGSGSVDDVPAPLVREQLRAVLPDLPPSAIKIGMLTTVPVIRILAGEVRNLEVPIVLDPLMVARDGTRLLRSTSVASLVTDLFPLVSLLTPNLPEASLLAGFPIRNESDAKQAARVLQGLGPRAVLIKGGYAEGSTVVDGLLDGRTWRTYSHPRIPSRHTRGVGCALSSAIAGYLSLGETLPDAVGRGLRFVEQAIRNAPGLGSGRGPLGFRAAGRVPV